MLVPIKWISYAPFPRKLQHLVAVSKVNKGIKQEENMVPRKQCILTSRMVQRSLGEKRYLGSKLANKERCDPPHKC